MLIAFKLHCSFIQCHIAEADQLRSIHFMTADNRPQPCQQFRCIEWLGQIIVRSGIQSGNPVLHFCPGSQHQAGSGYTVAAQFVKYGNAVHFRHHPIQDDPVKHFGFRQFQCIRTVMRCFNRIVRPFMVQSSLPYCIIARSLSGSSGKSSFNSYTK